MRSLTHASKQPAALAPAAPAAVPPVRQPADALQRSLGNRAVRELVETGALTTGRPMNPALPWAFAGGPRVQRKLAIGAVDDPAEREADRVANEVMRMPDAQPRFDGDTAAAQVQTDRSSPAIASRVQAKLEIGAVDDPLEREADRIADQVVRMPDAQAHASTAGRALQRECPACEEEEKSTLQTKRQSSDATHSVTTAPPIVHEVLRSPGEPLDERTRAFMEPRFGRRFDDVRVHVNAQAAASARAVNATAFTVGRHLVFGSGYYAPASAGGRLLLAHELTHVVQQRIVDSESDPLAKRKGKCVPGLNQADFFPGAPAPASAVLQRQAALAPDQDTERDKILIAAKRSESDLRFRAWEIAWRMLTRYFPQYASQVGAVAYEENEPGVRVDVKKFDYKGKKLQTATVTVGKAFVEQTSEETLRERIDEMQLGLALSDLQPAADPDNLAGHDQIWKIIVDNFPKKTRRITSIRYDANLPGLRTEFASYKMIVRGVTLGSAASGADLYVGKNFLKLDEPTQTAKIGKELAKIDQWYIDNFRVTAADLDDEDITARIRSLPITKLQEFRRKTEDTAVTGYVVKLLVEKFPITANDLEDDEITSCIRGLSTAKLEELRDKTKDPTVKAYVGSLLTISTPWVEGATPRRGGGFTLKIGNVTVVIEPDVGGAKDLTIPAKTAFAGPVNIRFISKDGLVKQIIPPKQTPTITIRTRYAPDAGPDVSSGYGRGTSAREKELAATTLRVHEGSHGADYIRFIRENKYPTFTGRLKMTVTDFNDALETYSNAVQAFDAAMESFSEQRTDCVGITIAEYAESHPLANSNPRNIRCGN